MSDLISRQDAIDAMARDIPFITFTEDPKRTAQRIIGTVPSADTDMSDYCDRLWKIAYERGKADRPAGEWVEEDEYGDLWVCDQCGFASEYRDNYCPNCGAKMRGENDDD